MATQYLNLDSIGVPPAEVTLNGEKFSVHQPTLKVLINISSLQEGGDDISEDDLGKIVDILHQLTQIPLETLYELELAKIQALLEFINGLGMGTEEKKAETSDPTPLAQETLVAN